MKTVLRVLLTTAWMCLLYLASCDERLYHHGPVSPSQVSVPTAVGVLWTYEVHDSLTGSTDTVQVSIVDTTILAIGVPATVWKCNCPGDFVSRCISVTGKVLAVYVDSTPGQPVEEFHFPLTLGSFWVGPLQAVGDTSRVTDSGVISVPAGRFDDGARVDRSWGVDFEGGGNWSITWIVPDVGMVYRYVLSTFSDGTTITATVNEVWKLLSYDLATFDIDQFPNSVGCEWVYETYDSSTEAYDTLVVSVIDSITIFGGLNATVWEYDFGSQVDSKYVVLTGNRVEIYSDTLFTWFDKVYFEFPLAVGRYWGIETFVPVPEVIGKGPVVVKAGTFDAGFHYVFSGGAFNYYWHLDDWLVPDVGLVYRTRWIANLGPFTATTWELLSYSIPKRE